MATPLASPMKDSTFNVPRPTNQAEYSALLDEAIRMGHELEAMWDAMSATLAANAARKAGLTEARS